jgi:hypothetical protein
MRRAALLTITTASIALYINSYNHQ